MKAVKAELKAGQQIVVHTLMQAKCAKRFIKAKNSSVIRQTPIVKAALEVKVNIAEGQIEVENVKKRLVFDLPEEEKETGSNKPLHVTKKATKENVADEPMNVTDKAKHITDEPLHVTDSVTKEKVTATVEPMDITDKSATSKDVIEKVIDDDINITEEDLEEKTSPKAKRSTRCMTLIKKLKEQFAIKDCSINLERVQLPSHILEKHAGTTPKDPEEKTAEAFSDLDDDDFQLLYPELKKCGIQLKDLKHHSWWGPKIKDFFNPPETPESPEPKSLPETPVVSPEKKPERSDPEVLDLTGLKEKVDNDEYKSVLAFHLDFKRVCLTVHVPGPSKYLQRNHLKNAYSHIMKEVFPWFDVTNPSANFEPSTIPESTVIPPYAEHDYSDHSLVLYNEKLLKEDPNQNEPSWKKMKGCGKVSKAKKDEDKRRCSLCLSIGDLHPNGPGRLVYFRQNEWLHVNCALWSSEVYEEIDGSLQNVEKALSRGSKLTCTLCKKRGATTGCCHGDCKCNYHFACGLQDGGVYKEDKTVYCNTHQHLYERKPSAKDFNVARTVHVDLENEHKRKPKVVDLRSVQVKIGSMTIHSLGHLKSVSDSEEALIPEGFICSRLFWSVKDPKRLTRYFCKTKIIEPTETKVEQCHIVVNHSTADIEKEEARLKDFQKRLRDEALRRERAKSVILTPLSVGHMWKHLSYKDVFSEDDVLYQSTEFVDDSQIFKRPTLIEDVPAITSSRSVHPLEEQSSNLFSSDTVIDTFTSPTKRLNKAVGNVLKRTPSKVVEDDLDLALDEGDFPLEEDHELISAILKDDIFKDEELDPTVFPAKHGDKESSPSDVEEDEERNWSGEMVTVAEFLGSSGMTMEAFHSMCGGAKLKVSDKIPILAEDEFRKMTSPVQQVKVVEEVIVARTWFNQNKRKKFSEVSLQCSLPFEKHVFDMDDDYSDVIEAVTGQEMSEPMDESGFRKDIDLEDGNSVDSSDILNYVAESMKKITQEKGEANPDMNEMEILNKILALSGDKIFEIGPEEQVFELDGPSNEITFSFPAGQLNDKAQDNSAGDIFKAKQGLDGQFGTPPDTNSMPQFDGANDDESPNSSSKSMPILVGDDANMEPPALVIGEKRKTEASSANEEPQAKNSKDSSADAEDGSPRKDFSIAGLLSPPGEPSKVTPEPSKSSPTPSTSRQKTNSPRKLLPKAVTPVSALPAGNPPVYIQHLSTPEMATSFADAFQQNTGNRLQYVTSISNIQGIQTLGTIQYPPQTLQIGSPVIQTIGSPFQAAAYPGAAPQLLHTTPQLQLTPQGLITMPAQPLSYVTPQGYIVNQPAAPGFINLGATQIAPAGATTSPQGTVFLNAGAQGPPTYISATPGQSPMPTIVPNQSLPGVSSVDTKPIATIASTPSTISALPTSSSLQGTPHKKIARVQPQPSNKSLKAKQPTSTPATTTTTSSGRVDPLKALSSMASHPMSATSSSSAGRFSITHGQGPSTSHEVIDITDSSSNSQQKQKPVKSGLSKVDKQRSVGTQARIGGPLKIITPRPWKGSDPSRPSSALSATTPNSTAPLPPSSGVSADENSSNTR